MGVGVGGIKKFIIFFGGGGNKHIFDFKLTEEALQKLEELHPEAKEAPEKIIVIRSKAIFDPVIFCSNIDESSIAKNSRGSWFCVPKKQLFKVQINQVWKHMLPVG